MAIHDNLFEKFDKEEAIKVCEKSLPIMNDIFNTYKLLLGVLFDKNILSFLSFKVWAGNQYEETARNYIWLTIKFEYNKDVTIGQKYTLEVQLQEFIKNSIRYIYYRQDNSFEDHYVNGLVNNLPNSFTNENDLFVLSKDTSVTVNIPVLKIDSVFDNFTKSFTDVYKDLFEKDKTLSDFVFVKSETQSKYDPDFAASLQNRTK